MNLNQLLAALITQTIVPELIAYLKSRGQVPVVDEAELAAILTAKCLHDIAIGEAFLRSKGIEP